MKMQFSRRVATLFILTLGLVQTQTGGAVTATGYDFAATGESSKSDVLRGGSFETSGIATTGGTLGATATVSSTSPAGMGSKDFSTVAVGGNWVRRDSYLRKSFQLDRGTYAVTITMNVSGVSAPVVSNSPGRLQEVAPGFSNLTNITTSEAYSNLQLWFVGRVGDSTDCGGFFSQGFESFRSNGPEEPPPPGASDRITPGSLTVTFEVARCALGPLAIEVRLIAEAWAAGDDASTSAGAHLTVTSIEVTSA